MKTIAKLLIVFLVLAGLLALFWQRSHSLVRQLDRARATIGTRQAGELLQRLVQTHPENAEVLFWHARQLRLEGQNGLALDSLKRASDRGWPQRQIERELLLLRAQTEFRQVEPALQALLDADPNDRDVLLALSLGWARLKNFKKGETLVNVVLERDPEDGAALCLRGRIRFQKELPHEARPDLEKALENGPEQFYYRDARLLLANCLLELGKFEEALQRFRESKADEPDNPRVLFGIGRCLWYLGRLDGAAAAFHELLQLEPDHLDALSQLAYIQEEQGELSQALELLELARKHDPTWYDLDFRMAKILRALGQNERAAFYQKRAELVQKRWATPRRSGSMMKNPYTGEQSSGARAGQRSASGPR